MNTTETTYTDADLDAWEAAFQAAQSPLAEDADEYIGCECERDWNCGHHGGTSRPTWEERRFTEDPDPIGW